MLLFTGEYEIGLAGQLGFKETEPYRYNPILGAKFLELDLTQENLLANVVRPYKAGKKFLCGGTIVDPFDIKAIQINETPQPSHSELTSWFFTIFLWF